MKTFGDLKKNKPLEEDYWRTVREIMIKDNLEASLKRVDNVILYAKDKLLQDDKQAFINYWGAKIAKLEDIRTELEEALDEVDEEIAQARSYLPQEDT